MKYVINGSIMAAITFMVVAAIMVMSGRGIRKNELEKALEQAAEQAVESFENAKTPDSGREECIDTLKRNMVMSIESNSKIVISVMALDVEKGILSVRAEEEFQNPLGMAETVAAEKTIILEKYGLEEKN